MKKFGAVLAFALGLMTVVTPARATVSWVSMAPITVTKAIANDSTITYYSESAYKLSQGTLVSVSGVNSAGNSSWFNRTNVAISAATKTTFTVNYANGATIPITGVVISQAGSSRVATYTTARAHELQVGNLVAVTGLSPNSLNTAADGVAVTGVTDTTFSVATTATVGTAIDSVNTLDPSVSQVLNAPVTAVSFAGSGSSQTATFTTRIPHGLLAGDKVAINGMSPSSLNIKASAAKTISSATSTSFTIPWTAAKVTGFNRTKSAFSSVYSPASLLAQSGQATSAFSWDNFHVVPANGVFESFHREYQSGFSAIYSASPSQHSVVYAVADPSNTSNSVRSVTFRFSADSSQIGKSVAFQFNAQSGADDSDITGHFSASYTGTNNTLTLVSDGAGAAKAEFTINRDNEPFTDSDGNGDVLNAAFVAGNSVLGDMTVHWARPGFGPIIKLVGTPTSPLGHCDPETSALTVHLCAQTGFRDETFDWSVANRPWFQEDSAYDYSQAWAKTYVAGDTVDMKYRVIDIWGNPIGLHNVVFAVDSGKDAKWSKDAATLKTNSDGYVVFQTKNLNTAAQVAAHVDYNPDTGKPTAGILSFQVRTSLSPTNPGPECSDLIWFQLNSGAPIADSSATFKLDRVGSVNFTPALPADVASIDPARTNSDPSSITAVHGDGTNMTYTADNNFQAGDRVSVRNMLPSSLNTLRAVVISANSSSFTIECSINYVSPCNASTAVRFGYASISGSPIPSTLPLDIDGNSRADIIAGQFSLVSPFNTFSYLFKGKRVSQPQELYDPNVTVTATNGGLAAVASAAQMTAGFADFTDASSFRSTLVFGAPCYTGSCIQDLVFMGTKPGVTTWTISLGSWQRTFSMTYDDISDASHARYLNAQKSEVAASLGVSKVSTFTLVDRNGNAYANKLVNISVTGVGALTDGSPSSTMTNSNGEVTVSTLSSVAGEQTVTVTADSTTGTQLADAEYSRRDATSGSTVTIPAGASSASTVIDWDLKVGTVVGKRAGATVQISNAAGRIVTITADGKSSPAVTQTMTSANQTVSLTLAKGAHRLDITVKNSNGVVLVTKMSKVMAS